MINEKAVELVLLCFLCPFAVSLAVALSMTIGMFINKLLGVNK